MGIFDQLKGPIIKEVMNLVQNQEGGFMGMVNKLKDSGLGDQLESWIGLGENKTIDANQATSALGSNFIQSIAAKLGVSHDEAAKGVAEALPQMVDKLTPNGKIEEGDILQKGISALKGLFG
jgi:uncharacterized protein YidB (DUF937 family)